MRTFALVLALAAVLPLSSVRAQETASADVSGTVLDAGSQQPVSGAAVLLPDLGRQAVTDSAGRFELRGIPAGEHRWIIRRVGYSTWEESATVADGDRFRIGLLAMPLRLEAVRVQADRLEARRRRYTRDVRVIEREEILAAAAPSARELVRYRAITGATVCPVMGGTGNQGSLASTGPLCVMGRYGRPEQVTIVLDEQPLLGDDPESVLAAFHPSEIYAIETYDGGRLVHVYTNHFLENDRSRLRPVVRRF